MRCSVVGPVIKFFYSYKSQSCRPFRLDTSLYSPDDALIMRNIYIERERFSECLFVKRGQVFPL